MSPETLSRAEGAGCRPAEAMHEDSGAEEGGRE